MRRTLIVFLLVMMSFCGFSQSKFSNLLQFNYIASSGGGDGSIVGLKYAGSFAVAERFTAGAGIAHDVWFDNRIRSFNFSSVIADLRYYFKETGLGSNFFVTPGYAVKVFDNSTTGFNLNTGLGTRFQVSDQLKMAIGLGYDFHRVDETGFKRTFRGVTFNIGLVL